IFDCEKGDNVHGKSNDGRDRRIPIRSDYLPPDCVEIFWNRDGTDGLMPITDTPELAELLGLIRALLGLEKQDWIDALIGEKFHQLRPGAEHDREIIVSSVLTAAESEEAEKAFRDLMRNYRYDEGADLALSALARVQRVDLKLMAHWSDRVGDAYRPMGELLDASKYYALASNYVSEALKHTPNDPDLRYQRAQTRFGQII